MNARQFDRPVSIFVGLGFSRRIETIDQAFQLLNEWTGTRSPTYTMALKICRAASSGEVDPGTARIAFEAFARARSILVPDVIAGTTERFGENVVAA